MKLRQLACAFALAFPLASMAATSGIDKSNFDPKVRIQDNLYQAVNGGWQQRTEIPADLSAWGAFLELRQTSEERVRGILEDAATHKDDASQQQLANFYNSFMDEATIEKLGITPIQPMLADIDKIKSAKDLVAMIGKLQSADMSLPFRVGVSVDAKDAEHYLAQMHQSGLGLPDRDYYLQKDARFEKARAAYADYLVTLFQLDGITSAQAKKRADGVIALEAKLAKIQWSKVDNRDPQKTYNKLDEAGLTKLAPGIDWRHLRHAAQLEQANDINVEQPSYIAGLAKLVHSEPVAVWRDYLRARTLDHFAPLLSKSFVDASYDFHDHTIAGAQAIRPRWKRGVGYVDGFMGEAVGKVYVAKYFPPEAKARMEELVGNLMKAYGSSIDALTWMSPKTKEQAKYKLAHYGVKIGYPERFRDYSSLQVKADDLVGNVTRGAAFNYAFELSHLGKPVDRTEWDMTPQTVNAYYEPTRNEIVFPAAILQPPFFNPEADDAVNYGGIGAVIGHEISHGFDDEGSQFDAHGNLHNWWQEDDKKAFSGLTDRLVDQYNHYSPIEGRFVNGKLTLGENIADNSGLQVAYKAYKLSLNGQPAPVLDGFTGDQRFFIGFAQVWRNKTRDARALQLLTIDPHSPAAFRPVGAAVNSDAFDAAFDVKAGDGMFKPENERIRIW